MPRKKTTVRATKAPKTKNTVPTTTPEAPQQTITEAVVRAGGEFHRVYSKEVHGDDFAEMAKSYISKPNRDGYMIEWK